METYTSYQICFCFPLWKQLALSVKRYDLVAVLPWDVSRPDLSSVPCKSVTTFVTVWIGWIRWKCGIDPSKYGGCVPRASYLLLWGRVSPTETLFPYSSPTETLHTVKLDLTHHTLYIKIIFNVLGKVHILIYILINAIATCEVYNLQYLSTLRN